MRFRVLGGFDALDDEGRQVPIAAAKERELLGALLAEGNAVVSVERLIDILWGANPPRTAHKTLQTYVSHLRRYLPGRILTRPSGYLLEVHRDELDSGEFEGLVADGRLALLRQQRADAVTLLGEALETWRGAPFEGLEGSDIVQAESVRLNELYLGAVEDWIEARLEGGEDHDAVAKLESLVRLHPLRERLWELLMIALYRAGRQAEALRTFQRARNLLVDELGIEPGLGLQAIEAAILAHDPKLDLPYEPGPSASYVTNPDGLQIAYWTHGHRDRDVVLLAEVTFNLELLWEAGLLGPVMEGLTHTNRLIAIQRRGIGLSDRDRSGDLAPPEGCIDDIDAVLDTVGAHQVSLVGWGHGGQLCLAYAARRAQRVRKVAVINSYARLSAAADYAPGWPPPMLEAFYRTVGDQWGRPGGLERGGGIFDPALAVNSAFVTRLSRYERLTASPREMVEILRAMHNFDIRWALPSVRCPVLVVRLTESPEGAAVARYLAEHLSSSQYMELRGHFIPTLEEGKDVARALETFLSE